MVHGPVTVSLRMQHFLNEVRPILCYNESACYQGLFENGFMPAVPAWPDKAEDEI